MIETLHIDLETFSSVDLAKCGVYRYTESPDFEILLFGYSINFGEVQVIDLVSGEDIPAEIIDALYNDSVQKNAFNAQFERNCLSRYLRDYYPSSKLNNNDPTKHYLNPRSWRCSMIHAAYLGLPLSLSGVGAALNLEETKMTEGKALIKYFSVPCVPTKANGGRTRNLPHHNPEKWKLMKEYNKQDVLVEMKLDEKLARFPVPDQVWEEFYLSLEIEDRGIAIDRQLIDSAIEFDARSKEELTTALKKITHLDNPNSVPQLKSWLDTKGIQTDSLNKSAVSKLIPTIEDPESRKALTLKNQLAKTSVKKYIAMQNVVCEDGRAHGMFQFYGANRTGRWAGRLINLQNLPRNYIPDLSICRDLVRSNDYDTVALLYDSVPAVLSELIRTAFIPAKGYKFIVADFSAIEARVLAHLAGEQWRINAFRDGTDIYCASASKMFGCPVEKNGINGELRQKGKVAELALGYSGSTGALESMGALEMGLSKDELQPLVNAWRRANPKIVNLWWEVDRAVLKTVRDHTTTTAHSIVFSYQSGMLFVTLPSGRSLSYVHPHIIKNRYGRDSVAYYGLDNQKRWSVIESYGPKYVENLIQAISRDILAFAMKSLQDYRICAHVHDELIIECPLDTSVEEICDKMSQTPPWIEGLVLKAEGYECDFYMKQ